MRPLDKDDWIAPILEREKFFRKHGTSPEEWLRLNKCEPATYEWAKLIVQWDEDYIDNLSPEEIISLHKRAISPLVP